MKYIVFLFALAVGAQSIPPSSNARTLGGKPPCSATITSNCISSAEYGAAAGAGDVLGAASVQSGRVPYGSGTASTITSSSKFAYNDTTGMGLIPPLSLGQNGTAAGRINLLGSTSGSYPIEVNADGTSITFTGAAVFTGPITAGASGPLDLTAIAAPSTPAAGIGSVYIDSTSKNLAVKDDAGLVKHGVQTKTAASNQVLRAIADDGTVTQSALASGDIPNNAANTTGSAATLTTTRAIYGNNFDGSAALTQIIASTYGGTGNGFTKFSGPATSEKTFTLPNATATLSYTVYSGSQALGTSAITANACASVIDITATGVASTDVITLTESADWNAITGYGKASTDGLLVYKWPTTDAVHIKVCNGTGTSITPGAATVNIRVVR